MNKSSHIDLCPPELLPYVLKYGGKFGPLEALRGRGDFHDHLIETAFVMPGETYQGNPRITKPFVRTSHPIDIHDMVGVLKTIKANDTSDKGVNEVIEVIRKQAGEKEVVEFANYSSQPGMYDPKDVLLGVQQLIPGVRATILSHPNRPEHDPEFIISWFRNRGSMDHDPLASGTEILTGIYNLRGKLLKLLGNTYEGPRQENMLPKKLIDLYEKVRATKLLRDDRSFVMETVGDIEQPDRPAIVCQLRDFKECQVADWRIDTTATKMKLPPLVFGITAPEGERLTVVHSPDGYGPDRKTMIESPDRPWAYLRTQHKGEMPLTFRPQNMRAYFAGHSFGSGMPCLQHSQERPAGMTDISVFENPDGMYDWPPSPYQYDFPRRLVAEMNGETLKYVRKTACEYARNTDAYHFLMEMILDNARGKMFDIILRCDGYTATIQAAPGQATRALREE